MHAVVASPNGHRLWVADARGDYHQSVSLDAGRRLARQEGLTLAQIASPLRAKCVVLDRLVERSSYDHASATVIEADPCRADLLVTAWIVRELLLDPVHVDTSPHLVARIGDDIFVAHDCTWALWDSLYWAFPASPGVDSERRNMALLSTGRRVTLSREGRPARVYVAVDLCKVWDVADQCARRYPTEVVTLRARGLAVAGPLGEPVVGRA